MLHETFGAPLLFGFGVVVFLVCGAMAGYLYTQANEFNALGAASEDWASAPGKVVAADYKTRMSRRRTAATINIRYTFEVDGRTYSGSTLAFEKLDSLRADAAEQRLKPYPAGATVDVYYDPEDPTRNVLEKGVKSSNSGLLWAAAAFLIGGLVALYDGVAGGVNVIRFPQS